jgi:hypothetical protein
MNIQELAKLNPNAANLWKELCAYHAEDEFQSEQNAANSYFTMLPDGVIVGDGAQEYTTFAYQNGNWHSLEDDDG